MKSLTLITALSCSLVAGCTSFGVVDNKEITAAETNTDFVSWKDNNMTAKRNDDVSLILAFSGGGTRAAALAYGVLDEMRKTQVPGLKSDSTLLNEVDAISSVSGGSFTSAYYGIHGEGMFDDFEERFLREDIEASLLDGILSPSLWFKSTDRTEMAVQLYDKKVFDGATFADMMRPNAPLIFINASDLAYGARFSFVQEYFNLLCSDLSSFSVARAVTASSAVPIVFNPIVVQNYDECKEGIPDWLVNARDQAKRNPELRQLGRDLGSFYLKDGREYVHFVDGGITDNLGLRAILELVELSGGASNMFNKIDRPIPKRLVIISVDASTSPPPTIGSSNQMPSAAMTMSAITDIQLHRYNTATLHAMERSLDRWASDLSTPEKPVEGYFIHLSFDDLVAQEDREYFNGVPTSFNLTDEQVTRLINAGGDLLRNNEVYQEIINELNQPDG